MKFLIENPLIILAAVLIALALCAYVISKPNKKGNISKKTSDKKVVGEKQEQTLETSTTVDKNELVSLDEAVSEEVKKEKKKLRRLKPEITRVFEKKQLQAKAEAEVSSDTKEKEEQELLQKMQFVKTSKKVAKLRPYEISEQDVEKMIEKDPVTASKVLDIMEAENQGVDAGVFNASVHFDRTRRLSNMIKNDTFDDMFCSHITEKYMNLDVEKHLRNCSEFQERLYHRAAKMMANSGSKLSVSDDGKIQDVSYDSLKAMATEKHREELAKIMLTTDEVKQEMEADYDYEDLIKGEFDLSARTVLVVDSILNRKGKRTRKG